MDKIYTNKAGQEFIIIRDGEAGVLLQCKDGGYIFVPYVIPQTATIPESVIFVTDNVITAVQFSDQAEMDYYKN